ncbi:MAG: hypothetical protein PUC90_00675 [Prevotella sp.]|nr:hypothetical protein [Prevotella sp.]
MAVGNTCIGVGTTYAADIFTSLDYTCAITIGNNGSGKIKSANTANIATV